MNEETTTVVNCIYSSYDVYIGRGSIWGNQFKVGQHGTREQVIKAYRDWLLGLDHLDLDQHRRKRILQRLSELKGKILGCWCKPLACHGDVLIELINHGLA